MYYTGIMARNLGGWVASIMVDHSVIGMEASASLSWTLKGWVWVGKVSHAFGGMDSSTSAVQASRWYTRYFGTWINDNGQKKAKHDHSGCTYVPYLLTYLTLQACTI